MPTLGKDSVQVLEEQLQEKLVNPLQTIEVNPNADLPFGAVEVTDPDPGDLPEFGSEDETDTITETAHLSVEEIQRRIDTQMMEDM